MFSSLAPFTKVQSCWLHVFEPQPNVSHGLMSLLLIWQPLPQLTSVIGEDSLT